MRRNVDVRTGEAVAIRYELAGLGSRFLAIVIDGIAQSALLIGLFVLAAFVEPPLLRALPSKYLAAAQIALAILIVFTIVFGWFVIFETWWSGRTPGKRALGLRVVRDGGFPVDWGASLIRNLVRLVELIFGFYALSAISALLSPENKRLGDYAAGTIVVRDRVGAAGGIDAYLAVAQNGLLSAEDRLLVERFLARRASFEPTARLRLAAGIATRLRPAAPAALQTLDDEALLEALALSELSGAR
ncbi:MAG TPA: RDD family protein [Candidatus Limnocylindria bacterium]|jgi:uncharacterized RDD family membrane protein YckC|nr:RDD family protein [Candidatus Limnocylindria bacterium]